MYLQFGITMKLILLLDKLYVGAKAVASGWGTLTEEGKVSCTLQEVEVPVITNEECKNTKYSSNMITDNMLCAGYPKVGQKDSCQVIFQYFSYIR